MTNPDYTALVLVVDRSGSMITIRKELEGGLKTLLEEQAALPGKCTVDVVLFDDRYEEVASFADPAKTKVVIKPRGMTAMYDAIGIKINSFGQKLSELPEDERPSKVMFTIATDGAENSSQEYNQARVAELIKTQRDQFAWEFVFLGANQNAVLTAQGLNISADAAITFGADAAGVDGSVTALRGYTTAYRSGIKPKFSAADRSAALK